MPATIRLSLAEYDAMIVSRVLDERHHQRIELIEGEMCEVSPPGPRWHLPAAAVSGR